MTLIIQIITLVVHDVKVVVNNIILVVSTMTMTLKLVSPSPSKQCTAMHQSEADLLLSTFTASQLCSMHLYLYSYFHFFCICICMCIFCICIVLAPSINNMHQSQADLLSTFTASHLWADLQIFQHSWKFCFSFQNIEKKVHEMPNNIMLTNMKLTKLLGPATQVGKCLHLTTQSIF